MYRLHIPRYYIIILILTPLNIELIIKYKYFTQRKFKEVKYKPEGNIKWFRIW